LWLRKRSPSAGSSTSKLTLFDQSQQSLDCTLGLGQLGFEPSQALPPVLLRLLAIIEVALQQLGQAFGFEDPLGKLIDD
jgi:hypothetical protein